MADLGLTYSRSETIRTTASTHAPTIIVIAPPPPIAGFAVVDDVTLAEQPTAQVTVKFSAKRRWSLLVVYSLAQFIDGTYQVTVILKSCNHMSKIRSPDIGVVWARSAFFIFTDEIANDLNILFEQRSWIIVSYSNPLSPWAYSYSVSVKASLNS